MLFTFSFLYGMLQDFMLTKLGIISGGGRVSKSPTNIMTATSVLRDDEPGTSNVAEGEGSLETEITAGGSHHQMPRVRTATRKKGSADLNHQPG